jgi:hypothetical protein
VPKSREIFDITFGKDANYFAASSVALAAAI